MLWGPASGCLHVLYMACAPDWMQCGGDSWNHLDCCEGSSCHVKDDHYSQCIPDGAFSAAWEPAATAAAGDANRPQYCQHSACSVAAGTDWAQQLVLSVGELEQKPWTRDISVGLMQVALPDGVRKVQVIRNPGGGTSTCCSMHPVAAAARVAGHSLQARLEPRTSQQKDEWASRNGARVYLAAPTPAPSEYERVPSHIPDPRVVRPPEWDDEDDGVWDPPLVPNPAYRGPVWDGLASTVDEVKYVAWELLDRTLAFTVDLSAASCGCNAAVYLVSMAQNAEPGTCGGDRYCDANAVCGVRCTEIDLLEANVHAFHTTAHTPEDGDGKGNGIGGSFGTDFIPPANYGPGSDVIDTSKPFRVSVYFASSGPGGSLRSIEVTLRGVGGTELRLNMTDARYARRLHAAVQAGMTPAVSYWSDAHLGWLQDGVCPSWEEVHEDVNTQMDACGEAITVGDLVVHDGRHAPPPPPPQPPPLSPPCPIAPPQPRAPLPPSAPPDTPWTVRLQSALQLGQRMPSPPAHPKRGDDLTVATGRGWSHPSAAWMVGLGGIGGVLLLLALRRRQREPYSHRRVSTHALGADATMPRPKNRGAPKVAAGEETAVLAEARTIALDAGGPDAATESSQHMDSLLMPLPAMVTVAHHLDLHDNMLTSSGHSIGGNLD